MGLIWILSNGRLTNWRKIMAYSKKVVDKFENTLKNPEKFNVGRFDPQDGDVGTGMVGAPACGDVMKLQIKCKQEGNKHIRGKGMPRPENLCTKIMDIHASCSTFTRRARIPTSS